VGVAVDEPGDAGKADGIRGSAIAVMHDPRIPR
jgi:hypothetical protein